jgi:hypothetical protein
MPLQRATIYSDEYGSSGRPALGLREVKAPTLLDKRPTDGGKVVSPTRPPPFTTRFLFSDSLYSFLLKAESNPGRKTVSGQPARADIQMLSVHLYMSG